MKVMLGDKIRLARLSKGLSQENVAEELGLSVGAYSNIERGKTKITIARLEGIAKALKTDLFTFLDTSSASAKGTKEPTASYLSIKRMEEKLKELESVIENKDKEIAYLKQIISLMEGTAKKIAKKK